MGKPYNRIVLIGNGYDRALGLKTSYKDFVLHLLKKVTTETFNNSPTECELISVKRNHTRFSEPPEQIVSLIQSMKTPAEVLKFLKRIGTLENNYEFFEFIVNEMEGDRWVDIENQYFDELTRLYEKYKKTGNISEIHSLNECMDKIAIELQIYIKEQQDSIIVNYMSSPMSSIIDLSKAALNMGRESLVTRHNRKGEPAQVIFVNFNYTNTITRLLNNSFVGANCHHIHIHGNVDDPKNPIIFGYGDDTHEMYKTLELSGSNELLRKIKSFEYPRTNNYHNLLNYLEAEEFDVFVVGHSCGLSDRTLLKTIFEHENCLAIQNFHYSGEQEDFNKRMEISRHFSDKMKMRQRVLSFDEHATIPQVAERS